MLAAPKSIRTDSNPQGISDVVGSNPTVGNAGVFREKLRRLNAAFLKAVEVEIKKEPSCSLVPLMNDYLRHTQTLVNDVQQVQTTEPPSSNVCPTSFEALINFFNKVGLTTLAREDQVTLRNTSAAAGAQHVGREDSNPEFPGPGTSRNPNICRYGIRMEWELESAKEIMEL